jgi:hypothetical protein
LNEARPMQILDVHGHNILNVFLNDWSYGLQNGTYGTRQTYSQIVKDRDEDMNHPDLVLISQFCMGKCTPKGVRTITHDLRLVTIENYHVSYQGNLVDDHVTPPPT